MKLTKIEKVIFAFMLVGAIAVLLLPDFKKQPKVLSEKHLLSELNSVGRYINTDDLAKMLITKDPSLILIDVRSKEEYEHFSLDGAMNIPMEDLLKEDNLAYLDQDVYNTVLYSNGTSLADEAWMIMKSHAYEGNQVLKGGLNKWFKTIIDPEKPDPLADHSERELYEFRKGASLFFTGVSPNGVGSGGIAKTKTKKAGPRPMVKRKKKEVSGGCG